MVSYCIIDTSAVVMSIVRYSGNFHGNFMVKKPVCGCFQWLSNSHIIFVVAASTARSVKYWCSEFCPPFLPSVQLVPLVCCSSVDCACELLCM